MFALMHVEEFNTLLINVCVFDSNAAHFQHSRRFSNRTWTPPGGHYLQGVVIRCNGGNVTTGEAEFPMDVERSRMIEILPDCIFIHNIQRRTWHGRG